MAMRQYLFRSAYLAAIATAMIGWLWMIFVGLEWAIGV
jgi:hypothetical protein